MKRKPAVQESLYCNFMHICTKITAFPMLFRCVQGCTLTSQLFVPAKRPVKMPGYSRKCQNCTAHLQPRLYIAVIFQLFYNNTMNSIPCNCMNDFICPTYLTLSHSLLLTQRSRKLIFLVCIYYAHVLTQHFTRSPQPLVPMVMNASERKIQGAWPHNS